MSEWILNKLYETKSLPTPRFAIQGTVNWMNCLAYFTENSQCFTNSSLKDFYKDVSRQKSSTNSIPLIIENMVMAYHNHSALETFNTLESYPNEICRAAIVSWYYSIYFTSSAMIAAATGTQQEDHSTTAKVWLNELVNRNFVLEPFSFKVDTLVKDEYKQQIKNIRNGNAFDLSYKPTNIEDSKGGILSYLQGTADYLREQKEERMKNDKDFKDLNVSNFRTKQAREYRDNRLIKSKVGFLHEAFRFRGKANYRDSIYLTYGNDYTHEIRQLCRELKQVSLYFQKMASVYIEKRVGKSDWSFFIDDLSENTKLGTSPLYLKIE